MLRHLPLSRRGNLCILKNVHVARVRDHINRGEKPHIGFYHVRYTSYRLARSVDLICKALRIYYDADDMRVLRVFLADGTELEDLKAGGVWAMTPRSLELPRPAPLPSNAATSRRN
jgi:hypothetical protein